MSWKKRKTIQKLFTDHFFYQEKAKKSETILDRKLFKKTYPYICNKCGEFAHTKHDYCDKCGAKDSLRKTEKQDYDNYNK